MKQLVGLFPACKTIVEICILGNHNSRFSNRNSIKFVILCCVSAGQVSRMDRIVSAVVEQLNKCPWQVGVNQKLHAANFVIEPTFARRAA